MPNQSKKEPSKKRPNMKSFEADPDVAQMLNDAEEAGAVLKELVNEALRIHGPEILAEKVKELRRKADEIEKRIGGGKR